jgi:hypothetical protein
MGPDPVGSKAPSLPPKETKVWAQANLGMAHCLLCQAQGFPIPSFR